MSNIFKESKNQNQNQNQEITQGNAELQRNFEEKEEKKNG